MCSLSPHPPFSRWVNWALYELGSFAEVISLVSGRSGTSTQVWPTPNLVKYSIFNLPTDNHNNKYMLWDAVCRYYFSLQILSYDILYFYPCHSFHHQASLTNVIGWAPILPPIPSLSAMADPPHSISYLTPLTLPLHLCCPVYLKKYSWESRSQQIIPSFSTASPNLLILEAT